MDCEANTLRAQCLAKHLREFGEGQNAKLALPPPAVRAPVFPHAFPVTEGLKVTIPTKDGSESGRSQDLSRTCLIRRPRLSLRCLHFVKSRDNSHSAGMPLVIKAAVGMAGIIETPPWIHPCAGCFISESRCWLYRCLGRATWENCA